MFVPLSVVEHGETNGARPLSGMQHFVQRRSRGACWAAEDPVAAAGALARASGSGQGPSIAGRDLGIRGRAVVGQQGGQVGQIDVTIEVEIAILVRCSRGHAIVRK